MLGKNCGFLTTLDDHSSGITVVCFLPGHIVDGSQMVSCGADKSIIFRDVAPSGDSDGGVSMRVANHIVGETTLYDIDSWTGRLRPSTDVYLQFLLHSTFLSSLHYTQTWPTGIEKS